MEYKYNNSLSSVSKSKEAFFLIVHYSIRHQLAQYLTILLRQCFIEERDNSKKREFDSQFTGLPFCYP